MSVTIVLQAGGESRRMGQNKALVPFLGQPLIERVYRRVQALADEVLITANQQEGLRYLGLPLVADRVPGKGALGGLYTAVQAAAHPAVIVLACDMPFVNPRVLAAELELLESTCMDVVIPQSSEGLEPLHAVFRRETCLPAIQHAVETDQRRLISWFSDVKVHIMETEEVRRIDPHLRTFVNVNTPEEVQQAETLATDEQA